MTTVKTTTSVIVCAPYYPDLSDIYVAILRPRGVSLHRAQALRPGHLLREPHLPHAAVQLRPDRVHHQRVPLQ